MRATLSTIVSIIAFFLASFAPFAAFASATDGTIDSTYRYAWSENTGWIDFGSASGNVHVTDSALTGSAYGENIGWLTLNPQTYGGVTNDGAGNLSGYAWSENTGWIDFSKVTIGADGTFSGAAYGENIGWLVFGTDNNKVVTDWRPSASRTGAPVPTPAPKINYGMPVYGIGQGTPNPLPGAGVPAPGPASPSSPPPSTSIASAALTFTRNLKQGETGEDVKRLQQFLNAHGFTVATSGSGSPGSETTYFGRATQAALAKFQAANGISPAAGYFGPLTRKFLREL